jgi:hypothetical protein
VTELIEASHQPATGRVRESRNTNKDGNATVTVVFNGTGSLSTPTSFTTVYTPAQPTNQNKWIKMRELDVVGDDSLSEELEGRDGNDDADNEDDGDAGDEGDEDVNPGDAHCEEDADVNP